MFPLDEYNSVYFERGIALEKNAENYWTYLSSESHLAVESPIQVFREHGLRPIMALGKAGNYQFELIIPSGKGRFLDFYRSELKLPREINFAMGAMIYHLKNILHICVKLCSDFKENAQIAKRSVANLGKRVVCTPEEPYFEFEALLSKVIQGYEYLRYPLWKLYGTGGSAPRKFPLAFESICSKSSTIPPNVRERIEISYSSNYTSAKTYRDCIHHNVDLCSSSWAMMEQLGSGIWSVFVRIPDNPESKSSKAFTYDKDLDALTIGWEYVSEFFGVIDVIFGAGKLS